MTLPHPFSPTHLLCSPAGRIRKGPAPVSLIVAVMRNSVLRILPFSLTWRFRNMSSTMWMENLLLDKRRLTLDIFTWMRYKGDKYPLQYMSVHFIPRSAANGLGVIGSDRLDRPLSFDRPQWPRVCHTSSSMTNSPSTTSIRKVENSTEVRLPRQMLSRIDSIYSRVSAPFFRNLLVPRGA